LYCLEGCLGICNPGGTKGPKPGCPKKNLKGSGKGNTGVGFVLIVFSTCIKTTAGFTLLTIAANASAVRASRAISFFC